jgi:hypothetical protein
LSPGALGVSDGAITWQSTLMLCSSRASSNPVGPVLVAGSQPAGIAEAANEPADRCLVVADLLDLWDLLVGRQIPTEMVSLWTSSPRWMGTLREILATAGSFRMVAPPAQCG